MRQRDPAALATNQNPGRAGQASPVPLFGMRGLCLAIAIAALLCWPLWLTGAEFIFPDTNQYQRAGRAIWSIVAEIAGAAPGGQEAGWGDELATGAAGGPTIGRSIFYSAAVYPLASIGGAPALAIFQGALSVFAVFALVDRAALAAPRILIAGAVAVALLTTLPWHTVFMMPDVLSAILMAFGAVLVGPFHAMSAAQKISITLLATFAAGSHYGNMPLAAGIALVAIIVAAATRRVTPALLLAAATVVLAPVAVNVAASKIVLNSASAAPLRLPILLARSLEDGPARRYLGAACPEAGYAICSAFDGDVPVGIDALLWDEGGVKSLDPEVMARIRAEEFALLFDVFRAYPLAQTEALTRNVMRQLTLAGTGQLDPVTPWSGIGSPTAPAPDAARLLALFDRITPISTLIAAVALGALLVLGSVPRAYRPGLIVIAAGLLGNAVIFGGLSAPVDRYQSRVIWLVPALLTIAIAGRRGGMKGAEA